MKRSSSIKSIAKAYNVLKALSFNLNSIRDISREVQLSGPTVYRLLTTMKEIGLVFQDPKTHQYYIGYSLAKLAENSVALHQSLIYVAQEKMAYLHNKTGETIVLDIKEGIEAVRLYRLTGTRSISYLDKRTKFAIWSGAIGRTLLSQLTEEEIDIIINNVSLVSLTPKTIVDKKQIKIEIDKVRQRGYTVSLGEVDLDVGAIAAPLENYLVPAAISIIGPEERIASRLLDFIDELINKTTEISEDLLKLKNYFTKKITK